MKIKKIFLTILLIIILAGFIYAIINPQNKGKMDNENGIKIVCTSFVGYDFVRNIVKDVEGINVTYLMDAGVDSHGFEPTAGQLIKMQKADLLVYNGGEMENWTEQVIPTLDVSKTSLIKLMDCVDLLEEEEVDGAEEHDHEHEHQIGEIDNVEWDEHVWTSPQNAIKIMQKIEEKIEELDSSNKEIFKKNSESYINKIQEVDDEIWKIVNNAKRTKLIFGDRMPMKYFLEEFKLSASGAFNGCSTETEPSTRTLSYLIDTVRKENIPVVLYIENGNSKIANIIAEETGAQALQIQTLHTISKEDFEKDENYVTLMQRNLEVLKKALQ